MALTLSKTLITTGQTVQASQITQSIDALTGAVAYDITISGSLNTIGPISNGGNTALSTEAGVLLVGDAGADKETKIIGFGGTTDIYLQEDIIRYNSTTHSFTGSIVGNLTGTSSFATTASYALNGGGGGAAYPTSAYIDNGTYGSAGTAYPINTTSAGILYIDTTSNSREVYFNFSAGATNQVITFTTYYNQTVSNMDPNFIYCTTAGIIYGLKGNTINNTTLKLADLVLGAGPAFTVFNTFQFQYTSVRDVLGWYLINVSVQ